MGIFRGNTWNNRSDSLKNKMNNLWENIKNKDKKEMDYRRGF